MILGRVLFEPHYCISPKRQINCIFKDRQQEARVVLVGSHYVGDYYLILELKYMYYIPLNYYLTFWPFY